MKAVGIVAEYNPFHSGHAYHIAETRRSLGADKPVVCVMSGSWVQRGECALTDKWTRAGMALRGGADLVLELPLPWAISSAEGFARGAVAVLKGTGVVDTLSFGSESGRVEDLYKVAKCLEGENYRSALNAELEKGISFADARQKAALQILGKQAEILRGANDSLGVEYLRAEGKDMSAIAILRQGVSHDSNCPEKDFASASYLREVLRRGGDVLPWMEKEDVEALEAAGTAGMEHIERAVLACLRKMREEDFAVLPDSGAREGLPARLVRAAGKAGTLEEFYMLAKTRRYAHARIRRLTLWAFLGMTEEDRPMEGPCYIRVLGMTNRGKGLLKEMKKSASLPVLTKPAHIRNMDERAQALFSLECRGTDMLGLCFDAVRPSGVDYVTGPVIL